MLYNAVIFHGNNVSNDTMVPLYGDKIQMLYSSNIPYHSVYSYDHNTFQSDNVNNELPLPSRRVQYVV